MKTHLLQPETHDDIISVLDQISWAKSNRILLVLPKKQNIIYDRLDLNRLHRSALKHGAALGLVTQEREILELASEVGVMAFPTVTAANSTPWRRSWKKLVQTVDKPAKLRVDELRSKRAILRPKKTRLWLRIVSFLAGILAMLALILLFTPRATVNVIPIPTQQSITLQLHAASTINTPDITGNIPVYSAEIVVVEENQVRTSGQELVPEAYASGEVEFTNLVETQVTVSAGTIVLTTAEPVVRFATIQTIAVAAGLGSTASTAVIALQPGEVGNVEAGQITAIEGGIGVNLSVTNPAALQGGGSVISPVGVQADLNILRENLQAQLVKSAEDILEQQMDDGIIILKTPRPEITILSEEIQPGLGIPSEYLQLVQNASVTIQYSRTADIEKALILSMDALLGGSQQEIHGSLKYTTLTEPTMQVEPYTWEVYAVRDVTTRIDSDILALKLRGMKLADAEKHIQNIPGVSEESSITIFPKWWQRLPTLSFQIEVHTP